VRAPLSKIRSCWKSRKLPYSLRLFFLAILPVILDPPLSLCFFFVRVKTYYARRVLGSTSHPFLFPDPARFFPVQLQLNAQLPYFLFPSSLLFGFFFFWMILYQKIIFSAALFPPARLRYLLLFPFGCLCAAWRLPLLPKRLFFLDPRCLGACFSSLPFLLRSILPAAKKSSNLLFPLKSNWSLRSF